MTCSQPEPGDNPALLLQDCSRPLFRWFLSRIDWKRILKEKARPDCLPGGLERAS
jgi:hypothetical protein